MELNQILDLFEKEIFIMNTGNLVICGIHALKLHGLQISREPVDLDIAVYKPTDNQVDFLESEFKSEMESVFDEDENRSKYRSWKIEKMEKN